MKNPLKLAFIALFFTAIPMLAQDKPEKMKATKECGTCCKQGGDCCDKCGPDKCAPCCDKKETPKKKGAAETALSAGSNHRHVN